AQPRYLMRRRAFALSWLAYASYYFCRKNVSVAKRTLEREMSMDVSALAAVDTGYLAAYAIGQFIMGLLGDRVGPRRLLGIGMIASALLVALAGASPVAMLLGVLFTVNGFAQATGWPGAVKAMTPWFAS